MAKGDEITTKFKVDISDLKKGISDANKTIKLANAEFKAASSGMDDWAKSTAGINAKLKQLESVLSAQNSKLKSYKDQLLAIENAESKNGQRVDELKNKMQQLASQGISKASDEYKKYEKALSDTQKEQLANKSAADNLKVTILNQQAVVNATEKDIRNYTKSLNELQTESSETATANNNITKSLTGVGNEADKAESKVGNLAKGLAKGLATAAVAGAAAAVAGLVTLTKTAISNYAEYEQLVGGVDTLFKESSGKVQDYAMNAYKTAGVSANDYMSAVTSFSASLLQSLGGDTSKAADVANMALIDMSDNANKMGTSMESIQNAYQGFAKQNYTMLDNLKLGYGGTKTEMQRLLSDATKLTGVKYNISNLNDVYQAIHVIQNEMGITGTTAKEASSTIQGSVASMKSAWTNLMTGMADETQNFDMLLNNFIDSIGNVIANLLPRVQTVVSGTFKLVQGLLPEVTKLIQQLLPEVITGVTTLLNGLISALPPIVQAIVDVMPQIITALLNSIPLLLEAILQIISSIITALGEMLPQIMISITEVLSNIVVMLIEGMPMLFDAAIQLFMGIIQAIPQIIQALVPQIPAIVSAIVSALISNMPIMIQGALQLFMGLIEAIPLIVVELIKALPQIITGIVEGLVSGMNNLMEIGAELGTSILEPLQNVFMGIGDWFNTNVIEPIKTVFSTVWEWFNTNVIIPITNLFTTFSTTVTNLFIGAWEGIKAIWSVVSSWFNDTLIKPITSFFTGMWNGLKGGATNAWNGIKNVFSTVGKFFKDIFGNAWNAVKNIFSTGGKVFDGIKEGIVSTFKNIVNGLIRGINKVIAAPFNAINAALDTIRKIDIFGFKPFEGLIGQIGVPQIPELRTGGILKKGQTGFLEGDGAEAVVPLDENKYWVKAVAEQMKHDLVGATQSTTSNSSSLSNINNFTQVINAPAAPSRIELYRDARNLLGFTKGGVVNV